MKTSGVGNSNIEQSVGNKDPEIPPQTREDVTKVSLMENNNRDIKLGKNRKRTLENIDEQEVLSQKENTVQNIAQKKQRKSEKKPDSSIRFDYSLGHFPLIDKSRAVRCKNDNCKNKKCDKKTFVSCSICDVHLCCCIIENRNCFTDFHTK